jgi:hypothetical protein
MSIFNSNAHNTGTPAAITALVLNKKAPPEGGTFVTFYISIYLASTQSSFIGSVQPSQLSAISE